MPYAPGSSKVTIVRLVDRQKWHQLAEILRRVDDRRNLPVAFDNRTAGDRLPEKHIVHLACQNRAPCTIIEMLAARYPESPSAAENRGRYPVHIACARGLRLEIVDFLLRSHPPAAGALDDYGKTPLHYACESYACNFGTLPGCASRSPERSLLVVVSMLLDMAPESPNVEDRYGMNAIEYALESEADISVIKRMQNSSKENWRTMRKSHRGMSHDKLRHSLTSPTSSFNSLMMSSEKNDMMHLTSSFDSLMMSSEKNDMMHRESEAKGAPFPPTRIDRTDANMVFARSA